MISDEEIEEIRQEIQRQIENIKLPDGFEERFKKRLAEVKKKMREERNKNSE